MNRKEIGRLAAFWLVGFVIGILFSYLSDGELVLMKQYMGMQSLIGIVYMNINYSSYLKYLFRKRGLLLAILLFGAVTVVGKYLISAFMMFLGISMGATLTFLVLQYQTKGILLYFGMLFPQILCYVPAISEYCSFLLVLNERILGMRHPMQIESKKIMNYKRLFRMIGVTIIGIVIECYVNPSFLKFIIKIM